MKTKNSRAEYRKILSKYVLNFNLMFEGKFHIEGIYKTNIIVKNIETGKFSSYHIITIMNVVDTKNTEFIFH